MQFFNDDIEVCFCFLCREPGSIISINNKIFGRIFLNSRKKPNRDFLISRMLRRSSPWAICLLKSFEDSFEFTLFDFTS